ncbi:hypothetical protein AVEN_104315-1 [Araneus ventricosus]|uniref:Uncharacterized protein n=1 Tax=Araneus ventricosus TaxID=182803 RepID=A0A4Y2BY50_ARAVE|nr:hypothetical protein AVEN_104315-1 [Araneus ventricosus]
MPIFSGGISDEAPSDATHTVAEDAIIRLTEFIQSTSPFVANISRSPRTGNDATVDNTRSICGIYNPCGWFTYEKFTRRLQEWTPSSCDCREGMECARYRDDISISSYEYRCKNITSPQQKKPW